MAEKIGRSGLRRAELEETCADIGKLIGKAVPPGVGFTFMLFDFGGEGNFAYMSSARRPDMVKMLREAIEKLEAS